MVILGYNFIKANETFKLKVTLLYTWIHLAKIYCKPTMNKELAMENKTGSLPSQTLQSWVGGGSGRQ